MKTISRPLLLAALTIAAMALVALWPAWWVLSVRHDSLVQGRRTWIPTLPFLMGDFKVHIDHVARIYTSGVNPYLKTDDWVCAAFFYPPVVLRLFTWVSLVPTPVAARIWLTALGAILLLGAVSAWRTRRELGLWPVPLAVVMAAIVYSSPAIMAMERGQSDPLVIPALLGVAWLLRGRTRWHELAGGGLLGVTAWLKYYPGLAVVALLAFRKKTALAAFLVVAGLIGVVDCADVWRAIEHGRVATQVLPRHHPIHPLRHSLTEEWASLWLVKHVKLLRQIPSLLAALALLLPAIAVVSRRLAQVGTEDRGSLTFPFLLWLTAAATYAMPHSNDYNLVSLPLAALCVWDRSDPLGVHVILGLLLLWWQPLALPIPGEILFAIKLASLYAIGWSLMHRASTVRFGGIVGECSLAQPPVQRQRAFARRNLPSPDELEPVSSRLARSGPISRFRTFK